MSPAVRKKEPIIKQVFIGRGNDVIVQDALERKLYVIRKTASAAIQRLRLKHSKEYYVPSMSSRTVIYKGLLLADQVGVYFKDLQDPRCVSALGLVHQRFSTNTFPEWPLAHPYRYVAHNGEINTVKGNYNWMKAREGVMSSPVLGADLEAVPDQLPRPVRHRHLRQLPRAADDGRLPAGPGRDDDDPRAVGAAHADGRTPQGVLRIPRLDAGALGRPGLHRVHRRPPDRRHAGPQRPAPLALLRDRRRPGDHGLRVRRAAGAGEPIVRKWRLQPGKMFLIDLEQGRMIDDEELKASLANAKPYKQWIENLRIRLDDLSETSGEAPQSNVELLDRQQAFGYTQEDIKFLMSPMAQAGEEGIGSMGNDSPLAVLSDKNKPLYNYFKQLFAQVTNPPIDPIREAIVMSLVSFIGPKPNLLDINQVNPPMRLEVSQPILDFADMQKLREIEKHTHGKFRSYTLDITYPLTWGSEGVEAKLASLNAEAVDAHPQRPQHPDHQRPRRRPDAGRHPGAAGAVVHPPAPGAGRPAHHGRPGRRDRFGARSASLRRAGRLRRGSRAPVPGDGDAGLHPQGPAGRPERRQGDLQLRQGDRQGPVEDHVQDGRVDLHVLLRRPAVRGHRPEQRHDREVLHRHLQPRRRHRRVRDRRRSDPHAQGRLRRRPGAGQACWTPAANTPGAPAAKSTCGRPTPSPSCSTARAPTTGTRTRNTPRSSTTRAAAT
jgi:hypothetical protein